MAVAFPSGLRPMARASKVRRKGAAFQAAGARQARAELARAGSDQPTVWDCRFVYTEAEAQTFVDWFFNDLQGGALLCDLPIRTEFGVLTLKARFLDDGLLATRHNGGVWEYTARVMTRESTIPPEAFVAWAGAFVGPLPEPTLTAGSPFSLDLAPLWSGGEGPFVWEIVSGVLPTGLELDSVTGVVSGVPNASGVLRGIVFRRRDLFCICRDSLVVGGDPFWPFVLLLHKADDQASGSLVITDSSNYADHKTAVTGGGIAIATASKKWGAGSINLTKRQPNALVYTGSRFSLANGEAMIFEGWCRRVSSVNATANPPIIFVADAFNAEVFKLSQYTNVNDVEVRFGTSDFFSQLTYTPDADGWWYWMVRIVKALDGSGIGQLWLGTSLVKQVTSITWAGAATVYVYGDTGTEATAINFYTDDTRITKADRYPTGLSALPGPFPTY